MDEVRQTALSLLREGRIEPFRVWIAFFGVGGTAEPLELEAYIYGLLPLSRIDVELLGEALRDLQET